MAERVRIIAVHGAGMNAAVFGSLAPQLTDYLFQAINLPGHGSDSISALADISAMSDWLRGKIDEYTAAHVVLLGHSMGGLVALAAATHPAVRGVVVMGTAATMPVHEGLLNTAKSDPLRAQSQVAKWSVDAAHPQAEGIVTILRDILADVPDSAIYTDLLACHQAPAVEMADKPLLVISGLQDKMVKPAQSALLAEKSSGIFIPLKDCGHMPMIERPVETAREIKAFIHNLAH